MSYSYDRRTAGVEDDATAAKKRNDEIQKASEVVARIEGLGSRFDSTDQKKLDAVAKKLLKIGDASEKAAKKALKTEEEGKGVDSVLKLLDRSIREWNSVKGTYATTRFRDQMHQANECRNLIGAAVDLNSWIMDLPKAITKGPNQRSVRDSEMSRMKAATAGGPDPLTYKAFLSEYEQGKKRGQDEGSNPAAVSNLESEVQDEMVTAAKDAKELLDRVIRMGSSGNVKINPQRFSAKMSQSLSTLLYNAGRYEGLKG